MHALSTITSPSFSEVIVVYQDLNFHPFGAVPAKEAERASWHHHLFGAFCEMRKVRDFQLVLRADVLDHAEVYVVQTLERAVESERAEGGYCDFFPKPSVIYSPRGSRPKVLGRRDFDPPDPWAPL